MDSTKIDLQSAQEELAAKEINRQVTNLNVIAVFISLFFFALLVIYILKSANSSWKMTQETLGQLGDYIGGIMNPMIAVIALAAVITGVRLQQKVLETTRLELREAQTIATTQATTAEQQRREQRFFDLLKLYQKTVDSLNYTVPLANNLTAFHGKSAIQEWLTRSNQGFVFKKFENEGFHNIPSNPRGNLPFRSASSLSKQELDSAWNHQETANLVDPYFRVIYRILSEAEPLLGKDHFRYVKLLRAQLNRNELTLLAYNMWLDSEGTKMRPLAEKYGLLKHLPAGILREEVEKILPQGVFGKQKELT